MGRDDRDDRLQLLEDAADALELTRARLLEYVRGQRAASPAAAGGVYPGGKRLLRVDEAAASLGVSRSTLYAYIRTGELEVVHLGQMTRVPVEAVDDFVARLRSVRAAGLRPVRRMA